MIFRDNFNKKRVLTFLQYLKCFWKKYFIQQRRHSILKPISLLYLKKCFWRLVLSGSLSSFSFLITRFLLGKLEKVYEYSSGRDGSNITHIVYIAYLSTFRNQRSNKNLTKMFKIMNSFWKHISASQFNIFQTRFCISYTL